MSDVLLDVRELTTKYITRFGEDVFAVEQDGDYEVFLPANYGKIFAKA